MIALNPLQTIALHAKTDHIPPHLQAIALQELFLNNAVINRIQLKQKRKM